MASTPEKKKNILLIGAGAVGQCYGFHLARAGHHITYVVRPQYVDALSSGLDVRCLSGSARGRHHFHSFGVETAETLSRVGWDFVFICVSSTALRRSRIPELCAELLGATIVVLQPGLGDAEYVRERAPSATILRGLIGVVSYLESSPTDSQQRSMTWWFPPLTKTLFSGERSAASEVARMLSDGACPAGMTDDVGKITALGSGFLVPTMASLELEQWSLSALASSERLSRTCQVIRDVTRLLRPGYRRWLIAPLTWTPITRVIIRMAPWLVPFDLDAMLRIHFTKVGDQTRDMLREFRVQASEMSQPSPELIRLCDELDSFTKKE